MTSFEGVCLLAAMIASLGALPAVAYTVSKGWGIGGYLLPITPALALMGAAIVSLVVRMA